MRPVMLPGVRINATPAAAAEPLPRMDMAVFAGFASAGPVHCAVAVDSPAAFAMVFGPDPVLAWDAGRGSPRVAALGSAVRAFFENGGRRAQVIRLCRTAESEALWRGPPPPGSGIANGVATANSFAIPGVLSLAAPDGALTPARGRARSLGSWSDGLALRARCARQPFRLTSSTDLGNGRLRFAADIALAKGDLIELNGDEGTRRTYLLVERQNAGEAETLRLASFVQSPGEPAVDGIATIPGLAEATFPARLTPASTGSPPQAQSSPRLEFLAPPPASLRPGHWLRWSAPGHADLWFDTGASGGWEITGASLSRATAWRIDSGAAISGGTAVRVRLDLDVAGAGGLAERRRNLGLSPGAASSWWQDADDDLAYRPGDDCRARPAIVRSRDQLPAAWLPLGLGSSFGPSLGPLPQQDEPLARDGLARFDAELFLDPRLANSGISSLTATAEAVLANGGPPLHGIHAILAIPPAAGSGELPSLVAVPDAVHPGWEPLRDESALLPPAALPIGAQHWGAHRGACLADGSRPPPAPAHDRFLDCGTRLLSRPSLVLPPGIVAPGVLTLSWTNSEPGSSFVLEESPHSDLSGAVEIGRTEASEFRVHLEREGNYYFRLTAHRDGESSLPALGLVRVRTTAYRLTTRDDAAGERARVHRALLRLAAAEGGLMALLSLPREADAQAARAAARVLTAERMVSAPDALAEGERAALSHGILLHGWLVQAGTPLRPGLAPPLSALPPCGAIAGVMARRALEGGAWLSPAGQPVRGAAALLSPLRDSQQIELIAGRVMPLRETPQGYVLTDAHTLSDEAEWQPVTTRRLFTLLRRYLLGKGAAYAFELNDEVLKRTIERGLSESLLTLFRAGAFAGRRPSEGFRVIVDPRDADRNAGRIVAEIAVAPSTPLAFLNVALRQVGERLTFEETR